MSRGDIRINVATFSPRLGGPGRLGETSPRLALVFLNKINVHLLLL